MLLSKYDRLWLEVFILSLVHARLADCWLGLGSVHPAPHQSSSTELKKDWVIIGAVFIILYLWQRLGLLSLAGALSMSPGRLLTQPDLREAAGNVSDG